jgi:hypothetical protein
MNVMSSPTIQTINLSSAGRTAVLAQRLAPEQLAAAISDWVDRLVRSAPLLDITLNTRDVRTLLPALIEELETVLAKSHPNELRGYGAMDSRTAQLLDQWCANGRVFAATLVSVWQHVPTPPPTRTCEGHTFPAMLALSPYQRIALGAYLKVANDALRALGSVLCLARSPYAPLFTSSLSNNDIACCDAACAELAALLGYGHAWVAQAPIDRRRDMVREHLDASDGALSVLFERIYDGQQRRVLAGILIELSSLKRRV